MTRREKSAKIAADLVAAVAERDKLREDIAAAARQIPMRGSLAIRVRTLREKYAKEIATAKARCTALEGRVREATTMAYPKGTGDWQIDFNFLHRIAQAAKWQELHGSEEAIEEVLLLAEKYAALAATAPGKPPAKEGA